MECDYFRSEGIWWGCVGEWGRLSLSHWIPRVVMMPTSLVVSVTETRELSWCQLHWWYRRLSLWLPPVPSVTKKLASRRLSVFSGAEWYTVYNVYVCVIAKETFTKTCLTLHNEWQTGGKLILSAVDCWPSVIAELTRTQVNIYQLFTKCEWWCHQMENVLRYWSIVRGIHRSPMNLPLKGQWHGSLMFSSKCTWTNG